MASASDSRSNRAAARIGNAATTLYSENQSLVAEIRKGLLVIKGIAVDLEKENQLEMVKELEAAVIELLATSDDCTHFSSAIQTVGNEYQPGEQLTDFMKVLEGEVAKFKTTSPSVPENHPFLRQFREAIWTVHHAGQPMPGEEQEDIIMTSTQSNLLNITCPLSGKPVIELESPVRCMDCKHIYEKMAVMHYIKSKNSRPQCPVAGCPKILEAGRVMCDPLLVIEIDELRSRSHQTAHPSMVEDFTELDDD